MNNKDKMEFGKEVEKLMKLMNEQAPSKAVIDLLNSIEKNKMELNFEGIGIFNRRVGVGKRIVMTKEDINKVLDWFLGK